MCTLMILTFSHLHVFAFLGSLALFYPVVTKSVLYFMYDFVLELVVWERGYFTWISELFSF